MTESPKAVSSYTALSVLAQIMTGLGFITMILGAVVLALDLIGEFAAVADEKKASGSRLLPVRSCSTGW